MEPVETDEEEGTVFSRAAHSEHLATRNRREHPEFVFPEWCYSVLEEGRKEEEKEEKEEKKKKKKKEKATVRSAPDGSDNHNLRYFVAKSVCCNLRVLQ